MRLKSCVAVFDGRIGGGFAEAISAATDTKHRHKHKTSSAHAHVIRIIVHFKIYTIHTYILCTYVCMYTQMHVESVLYNQSIICVGVSVCMSVCVVPPKL